MTESELPVACTLTEAEMADRRSVWQRLADESLNSAEEAPGGVTLRYAARGEVEATLRRLVELETECCSFASWRLRREERHVVLDVTAPGDGEQAVRAMFGVKPPADPAPA